jgi:hypothetical protein
LQYCFAFVTTENSAAGNKYVDEVKTGEDEDAEVIIL